MSDPFEIRLNFINALKRLTSSQNSINNTVRFLVKHGPKCGEDLWDCLMEECEKASLNARINMLYLLDTLLLSSTSTTPTSPIFNYPALIKRDLAKLVDLVVPPLRDGLLNLLSARQMLTSWKTKRAVEVELVERIEATLKEREEMLAQAPPSTSSSGFAKFTKRDILERIDDDRERHKRLRERLWVLPIAPISSIPQPSSASLPSATHRLASFTYSLPASPSSPASPATRRKPVNPNSKVDDQDVALALEVEFEQLWEANGADVGDKGLDDADWEAMRRERRRCFED